MCRALLLMLLIAATSALALPTAVLPTVEVSLPTVVASPAIEVLTPVTATAVTTAAVPSSTTVSTTAAVPTSTDVSTTAAVPTSTIVSTTAAVPTSTDVSTTGVVPTSTDVSTTGVVPISTDVSTTAAVPTSTIVVTTAAVPTSTIVSTTAAVPTSTDVSTTAAVPTSTIVSTTAAVPTSTDVSTTAAVPTSTIVSTTASVPASTDVSTTAAVPTSTDVSTTPSVPMSTTISTTLRVSPVPSVLPSGEVPVVAGSMGFALSVEAVRRRLPELQRALAAAASVELSAVRIISVLPGSTVVRFQIVTNTSAGSLAAVLRDSASNGDGALSVFAPLVETLSLTQRTTVLLFEPGWGLYSCLIIAGAVVLTTLAWALFRKCRPRAVHKTLPVVEVDDGAISIHVTSDDGTAALVPFLRIGPQGPLTECCIVRMPTRGEVPLRSISSDDISDVDSHQAVTRLLPVVAAVRVGRSRRQQPKVLRDDGAVRAEPSAREECASDADGIPLPRSVPLTYRDRLARLQPSREVIGDDIAASYAVT